MPDHCEIRVAFKGVTLGNGVGLLEAQGLDDHEDAATCARYRDKDEKEDWEKISSEALNSCYSSLSFFDAEGMRFHLPAYLIADLKGEYRIGMEISLTHLFDRSQFDLLTADQRMAVRRYLLHLETDPHSSYHHADIGAALEYYWTETTRS
ncbi:MAG: hypothetical protein EOP83_24555 [Verrucomicrobiaceae bacterium]|nr:MAG: hypothetical protein EOP83_24555 [Verrucomicrobiaceae bacterium]